MSSLFYIATLALEWRFEESKRGASGYVGQQEETRYDHQDAAGGDVPSHTDRGCVRFAGGAESEEERGIGPEDVPRIARRVVLDFPATPK